MSTNGLPAGRKRGSRKSIAIQPTSGASNFLDAAVDDNKENAGSRNASSKRLRSKSLGPGELQNEMQVDNEETAAKIFKSILQPAIPISPVQHIPGFNKNKGVSKVIIAPPIMVPLKTDEEQQEARQQREAQRSHAMTHREKRRKSLAGRRVSFNPEVTMHVLEEQQVQQTPSTSDSHTTRTPNTSDRAAAAVTPTPFGASSSNTFSGAEPASDQPQRPSTPPRQVEIGASEPESARLEHKKENRKVAPVTPMMNLDHTNELPISPTPSSVFSSPAMTDDAETTLAPEDSSDEDDTGLISVVSPSVTARTDGSDDDSDDMSIVDDNEVTATFTPWIAREHNHPRLSHPETHFTTAAPKAQDANPNMPWSGKKHDHPRLSHPETDFSSAPKQTETMQQDTIGDEDDATMEITRVVGNGLLDSPSPSRVSNFITDDDMTMDITQAIGPGILSNRRLSTVSESTDGGDMTMEITRAIGPGLLSANTIPSVLGITYPNLPRFSPEDDEDQTMEFTRAIGGIQSTVSPDHHDTEDEEMSMDLTRVIGGVLSAINQPKEPEADTTESMDMDVTMAIGGILDQSKTSPSTNILSPFTNTIKTNIDGVTLNITSSPPGLITKARDMPNTGASLAPENMIADASRDANTPTRLVRPASPQKVQTPTPKPASRILRSRTVTPQGTTPKAPVMKPLDSTVQPNLATPTTTTPKIVTPKRMIRSEITTPTPKQTTGLPGSKVAVLDHGLSAKRRLAGASSPAVHLEKLNPGMRSPSARVHTGIGISKPGLGSPSVQRILSGRKSLGDDPNRILSFSPGVRPLSQLLKDLKDDQTEMENSEAEDQEAIRGAAGIKEMLERMTPKKDSSRSFAMIRDSSAAKRSFEDARDGLFAAAISPGTIKHLELGPTESPARKKRKSLDSVPPAEKAAVRFDIPAVSGTPKSRRNAEEDPFGPSRATMMTQKENGDADQDISMETDEADDLPNIAMKDFLGMIGISFMDSLTTSKLRRQTGAVLGLGVDLSDEEVSMADQVTSLLTIYPLLDLYDHLKKELQRSNKDGKQMFKKIEEASKEKNPALFREYIRAPPDVRSVMDMQFKNIKTGARLEARSAWYDWRYMLQKQLKDKADENLDLLRADEVSLAKRRELVNHLLPLLTQKHAELTERAENLRVRKEEIEASDPQELAEKRIQLQASKKKLEEKKAELVKALEQVEVMDSEITDRENRKASCLSEIESAEKVAEANRGFTEEEVLAQISRVQELEKQTGWSLKSAERPAFLVMVYKDQLEVKFDVAELGTGPVALKLLQKLAPTVEQQFFLDTLTESVKNTSFKRYPDLLRYIQERWDKTVEHLDQMNRISKPYPNRTEIDERGLVFTADMLVIPRKAKVRVTYTFKKEAIDMVHISAETIYGEGMSGWKLDEYLNKVVSEGLTWRQAMSQLGKQLAVSN